MVDRTHLQVGLVARSADVTYTFLSTGDDWRQERRALYRLPLRSHFYYSSVTCRQRYNIHTYEKNLEFPT